jgi:hypothetical protein
VLEGSTGTGVKLFADVFDQVDILVMASNKKELGMGFAPYPKNKPAVFEAYLGSDPLQIFLVAKDSTSLYSTFSNLLPMEGPSEIKLDSVVAKVWRSAKKRSANDTTWETKGYKVFATLPLSATREEWERRFRNIDPEGKWPQNLQAWDTQVTKEGEIDAPSIFLGSRALNHRSISALAIAKVKYRELEVIGSSGRETRELYLYGRVLTDKPIRPITSNSKILGYEISKPVSNTLSFLYSILDGNPNVMLSQDEIKLQRNYFHLDDKGSGWVPVQFNGHESIYRAEVLQSQTTKK